MCAEIIAPLPTGWILQQTFLGLYKSVSQSEVGVTIKKIHFRVNSTGKEDRMQPPDTSNKHVACESCIKNIYVVVKKVGGGLLTYDGTQT